MDPTIPVPTPPGREPPTSRTPPRRRSSVGSGGHIRIGTASWTDPTMTATGVFYPTVRDDRRGAAPALRVDVPAGRGGRHVLRASVGRDREAVGRADAARLRVRHQGPRPDDRPGHRDQAPAEGPPRASCPSPSRPRPGSTPRTSRPRSSTRSGRPSGTASSRSPRPASWARSCSSTRAGSSRRRRTGRRSRRPPCAWRG